MDWLLYILLFVVVIPLLKRVIWEIKYYLTKVSFFKRLSRYSYFFGNIVSIGIIIFLTKVQLHHNWLIYSIKEFDIVDALTFSFSILGIYGIYFGFLQFLVGFDKNDIYLGRSKANKLINGIGWNILVNNFSFKAMLFFLILLPVVIYSNYFYDFADILIGIWQTSVVYLLVIYVFLIINSLRAIRLILSIKENDDYFLKRSIEEGIETQYRDYFIHDFYNRDSVFFFALNEDLENIKKNELMPFYEKVFQSTIYEETVNKLKKINREFVNAHYKKFLLKKLNYLITANLKFDELLSFYKNDLFFLDRLIKTDEAAVIKDFTGNDNTAIYSRESEYSLHNMLFYELFKKVDTTGGLHKLLRIINKEITWKIIYYKEDKTNEYFRNFLKAIYIKLLENYFEEKNALVKIETIIDLKESGEIVKEVHSKYIFDFLINTFGNVTKRFSKSEKEKFKLLINTLDKEYRMAYILYQLFYPGKGEWDANIDLYKELLMNLDMYDDYRAFSKKVSKIISDDTQIGHRFTFEKSQWLFDTKNNNLTYAFLIQIRDRNLPLLKVLLVQQCLSNYQYLYLPSNGLELVEENDRQALMEIERKLLDTVSTYPDSMNEPYIKDVLKAIFDGSQKFLKVRDFNYMSWKDIFIVENNKLESRESLSCFEKIYYVIDKYFGEDLCKFYILKLNDYSYEDIFRNRYFLTLFLKKTREVLQNNNMNVKELVDELVSEIAPFQLIGKYEVEIICKRLQYLLDTKYLPIRSNL
ncbi:MAG TPA: hypothetical protein DEO65_02760 [Bacillus bacterium]|uniref:hypothetical protein n=1 Tax=Siminovitchia fordii TaxID=254759 RepID=UPI000364DAE2|nr:hypothetical protein [Siminovitchia fordii]HBZ08791.1 hypothetical protein [Bacillus sp. (in: firmicutes)]